MFSIHSSSFRPDFPVARPALSRVAFHVESAIFVPGNLTAWDERAWNLSRVIRTHELQHDGEIVVVVCLIRSSFAPPAGWVYVRSTVPDFTLLFLWNSVLVQYYYYVATNTALL